MSAARGRRGGPNPSCPKCRTVLRTRQVALHPPPSGRRKAAFVAIEVAQCPGCAGVWFPRGSLERYLEGRGDRIPEKPILPSLLEDYHQRFSDCPACRKPMVKSPVGVAPEVLIDRCRGCGGVWLDDGEVQRLVREGRPASALVKDARSRIERVLGGWLPMARH